MRTGNYVPHEFARYIIDSVESDGALYRQQYRPIVLNLARRKVKGIYQKALAEKLVMYLAIEGIRRHKKAAEEYYEKRFGDIPHATKLVIAKELLAGMQGEIMDAVREMKATAVKKKPARRKKR